MENSQKQISSTNTILVSLLASSFLDAKIPNKTKMVATYSLHLYYLLCILAYFRNWVNIKARRKNIARFKWVWRWEEIEMIFVVLLYERDVVVVVFKCKYVCVIVYAMRGLDGFEGLFSSYVPDILSICLLHIHPHGKISQKSNKKQFFKVDITHLENYILHLIKSKST